MNSSDDLEERIAAAKRELADLRAENERRLAAHEAGALEENRRLEREVNAFELEVQKYQVELQAIALEKPGLSQEAAEIRQQLAKITKRRHIYSGGHVRVEYQHFDERHLDE